MSSEIVDSQELTTFIPQFTTCMWISCGKVLVKVVKIVVVAFMVILLIKYMMRSAMIVKGINNHHFTMFLKHYFFLQSII